MFISSLLSSNGNLNPEQIMRNKLDIALRFFDKKDIAELCLPESSEDLLLSNKYLFRALGIYESIQRFHLVLRMSPFRFEDFCVVLMMDEQSYLLSEIHINLLKALMREDDLQGTHYCSQEFRDSLNIHLLLCDHLTWPEVLRIFLAADLKKNEHILNDVLSLEYPFVSIEKKLEMLEYLLEEFLNTSKVRENVNLEGVIANDDHCRVCSKDGKMIFCESCPASFHLACLDPPMRAVPTESWSCPLCNQNAVNGVTDCKLDPNLFDGLCRQEPIGYDRHGRKYWFLSRRIIVEDPRDGQEEVLHYYSTKHQLDELLDAIDEKDYEEDLYKTLKELEDIIAQQMSITEKLTKIAKGSRKSYIETVNEELSLKWAHKQRLENAEVPQVHEQSISDVMNGLEGSGGIQTRLRTRTIQPKNINSEALKNKSGVYNLISNCRDDEYLIVLDDNGLTKVLKKSISSDFYLTDLFKLGLEGNYKNYLNLYVTNIYALNKYQQNEERDRRRHLQARFSIHTNLKWGETYIDTLQVPAQSQYGNKEALILVIKQALLFIENKIPFLFFHPQWVSSKIKWTHAVTMSNEMKSFSMAFTILESHLKPLMFTAGFHDLLGFTFLQRSTQLEREDLKKKDSKKGKYLDTNETMAFEGVDNTAFGRYGTLGNGVKLIKIKLKHQIWKSRGEEFRLSGFGGWRWNLKLTVSAAQYMHSKPEMIQPLPTDNSSDTQNNDYDLIDISKDLTSDQRQFYSKFVAEDWNVLLHTRLEMAQIEKANDKTLSPSPMEHVDLHKVVTVNNVKTLALKTFNFSQKARKVPLDRFKCNKYLSYFFLTADEYIALARRSGNKEVIGFNYIAKNNTSLWNYGQAPRPHFGLHWLMRTVNLKSISALALQLRVLFASIRWEDLKKTSPLSGSNIVTSESDITTIELIGKRELPPDGLRSEYKVRKIVVPLDIPTVLCQDSLTPSRSGLRTRKRLESSELEAPKMYEVWTPEEALELWQIRQYATNLQNAKTKEASEALRKKNEEETKNAASVTLLQFQSPPTTSTPKPFQIQVLNQALQIRTPIRFGIQSPGNPGKAPSSNLLYLCRIPPGQLIRLSNFYPNGPQQILISQTNGQQFNFPNPIVGSTNQPGVIVSPISRTGTIPGGTTNFRPSGIIDRDSSIQSIVSISTVSTAAPSTSSSFVSPTQSLANEKTKLLTVWTNVKKEEPEAGSSKSETLSANVKKDEPESSSGSNVTVSTNVKKDEPKADSDNSGQTVITAEITQEIIRKALMNEGANSAISQKLMALQKHYQNQKLGMADAGEEEDHLDPSYKQPRLSNTNISGTSRSPRQSRINRSMKSLSDYVYNISKSQKKERLLKKSMECTALVEKENVESICQSIMKSMLNKVQRQVKRRNSDELNEERKKKRFKEDRKKFVNSHTDLVRHFINCRKAKLNIEIRQQVQAGISQLKTEEGYCFCNQVYDAERFYIFCEICTGWFHGRCVGITEKKSEDIYKYICPQCSEVTSLNRFNHLTLTDAEYIKLSAILKSIQTNKKAWPFLKPVDKKQVPDYYEIIEEPMDLKMIETLLASRSYKKLGEFLYDMAKMFENCRLYNSRTTIYYQLADDVEEFFQGKMKTFRDRL